MPVGVLTHKNSLISKESYNKILDRPEAIFDSDTPMAPGPKLKKKKSVLKNLIVWCSHRTFDRKKIFRSYCRKHHGELLYIFWVIFKNLLECKIDFSKFYSNKKNLPSNGSNTKFSTTFFEAAGGRFEQIQNYSIVCVTIFHTQSSKNFFGVWGGQFKYIQNLVTLFLKSKGAF